MEQNLAQKKNNIKINIKTSNITGSVSRDYNLEGYNIIIVY